MTDWPPNKPNSTHQITMESVLTSAHNLPLPKPRLPTPYPKPTT